MKMSGVFKILLAIMLLATGQAFAWTISADFENVADGQLAQGTSGFSFAGTATTASTSMSNSGSKSARMVWTSGMDGWATCHGEIGFPAITDGTEIWIRGYYYFSPGWQWGWDHVKIMRFGVEPQRGWLSIIGVGGKIIASNEVPASAGGAALEINTGVSMDIGAWQSLEMYFNFSTSSPKFRIWKNGALVYEGAHVLMASSSDTASMTNMMNTWNGGCPADQTMYIDDFVVTTNTPSGRDAAGNPMIGGGSNPPTEIGEGSSPPTEIPVTGTPAPPTGLKVMVQ